MAMNSSIEWTDHTFNPWWGCTEVSPGCDHCYARKVAARFAPGQVLWGVDAGRRTFGERHWSAPVGWTESPRHNSNVTACSPRVWLTCSTTGHPLASASGCSR